MSGHESISNGGSHERPEHERLPDYEIDLTGSVNQPDGLMDVIGDAIIEAGDDGEVPDWGARVMARYLANIMGGTNSALHHFAVTTRADYDRMGDELSQLWEQYADDDLVGEIINRLGTYLIAAVRAMGESTQPEGPQTPDSALQAFLQLPDVSDETAASDFHESYYGSFRTIEAVVQHVGATHDVWELLEEAGLSHLASPDRGLLLKLARQRWDIVQHDGRFHLFEK